MIKKGYYKLVLAGLVFVLFYPATLRASNGTGQSYNSTGTAYILNEDISNAKHRAISDGLRTALSAALNDLVEPLDLTKEIEILKDKYFYHPEEYVWGYRLLSEGERDGFFWVDLEAQVAVERLKKSLTSVGIFLKDSPAPSLLIMSSFETNLDRTYFENFGEIVAEELLQGGFDVQNPFSPAIYSTGVLFSRRVLLSDDKLMGWGRHYGTDIAIAASTQAKSVVFSRRSDEKNYQFITEYKAVDSASGEKVLSGSIVKVHTGEDRFDEIDTILERLMRNTTDQILVELMNALKKIETKTEIIEVVLQGVDRYKNYALLKGALVEMKDIVESMEVKRFSRGEVAFNIKVKGNGGKFFEQVKSIEFPELDMKFSKTSNGNVTIEVLPYE